MSKLEERKKYFDNLAKESKTVIRCGKCHADITDKVKVYWRGRVTCQECNVSEK